MSDLLNAHVDADVELALEMIAQFKPLRTKYMQDQVKLLKLIGQRER